MSRVDRHLHTTFSDGDNTPEEMVKAAIEAGYTAIGFADHAYTSFDESYCMPRGRVDEYRQEIARLREVYRDRIAIFCGIEQDYYADLPAVGYDPVIGSVHYLKRGDRFYPVDESPAHTDAAIRAFGGDPYAFVEAYFETVADVVRKTGATVIGHFDLIAKYNEQMPRFDETHPRYVAAWKRAADALLKTGVPFEVNTGAQFRGIRSVPYPAPPIQSYLKDRGATLIPAGDCHCAEALSFSC